MDHEFVDGRLMLHRTPEERVPLLQRLSRIEGQVRGLRQMIEQDRYCLDEIQQVNAVVAAIREVALMISGQHLSAGIDYAARSETPAAVLEEVKSVLRSAIRQG